MQLSEILEENSLKAISKKTNIAEINIEALLEGNFHTYTRIKTLGFISIIEREYKADLSELREEVNAYYAESNTSEKISFPTAPVESERSKPKWLLFLVLGLLGYASWYFFTNFEQKQLNNLLPYFEDKLEKISMLPDETNVTQSIEKEQIIKENTQMKDNLENSKEDTVEESAKKDVSKVEIIKEETIKEKMVEEELSIENVIALVENTSPQKETIVPVTETNDVGDQVTIESESMVVDENQNSFIEVVKSVVNENSSIEVVQVVEKNISTPVVELTAENNLTQEVAFVPEQESVFVVPAARLWFGVIEMSTKKRDQYSLSKKFELDTKGKSWLLATSPASFSLVNNHNETKKFKDAKAHYFKIDENGTVELSKKEYRKVGGYRRW